MTLTGIIVMEWHVCKRKVWVKMNGVSLERQSDLVAEGKRLQEKTYRKRAEKNKQLELPGIKVDYYDPATQTIHETKKSPSMVKAHRWQVKYYLYVMRQHGIGVQKGILEYPKHHKKEEVFLSEEDEKVLQALPADVEALLNGTCPPPVKKRFCQKCAFCEFCYTDPSEEF